MADKCTASWFAEPWDDDFDLTATSKSRNVRIVAYSFSPRLLWFVVRTLLATKTTS